MSALIVFENVTLGYGRHPLLTGLTFAVGPGDMMGIVGPNGSGKTTILRGILGLIQPLEGRVEQGKNGLRFGYVPQRQTVDENFPLTVFDVALLGRYRQGKRRITTDDRRLTRESLIACDMESHANTLFRNLSGGQKQRTLIARALAVKPEILVLDEPTSGMDLRGTANILGLINHLNARGLTVILVSHQLDTVAKWVRTLGVLHEGHLRVGPVDEVLTRETLERVYGEGADVAEVRGERVVLPPRSRS